MKTFSSWSPRYTDRIAGGASLAPRRWSLAAEAITARLEETFAPEMTLESAVRAAVDALAGPERTLGSGDLEVAVLARGNGRRKFDRIEGSDLDALLGAATS